MGGRRLTGFFGDDGQVVPGGRLSVERLGDGDGSVVWVDRKSLVCTAVFIQRISGGRESQAGVDFVFFGHFRGTCTIILLTLD